MLDVECLVHCLGIEFGMIQIMVYLLFAMGSGLGVGLGLVHIVGMEGICNKDFLP